jgi:hypothetical protein
MLFPTKLNRYRLNCVTPNFLEQGQPVPYLRQKAVLKNSGLSELGFIGLGFNPA